MEGRRNHSDDSSTCNGETSNSVKCVKCPEEANLKSNNTSYCEKCFLTMVKGKFRSALSKRKIFRDKDSRKALVVLDGSRESAFLFRQIEDSVKQTNFKRLMIEPSYYCCRRWILLKFLWWKRNCLFSSKLFRLPRMTRFLDAIRTTYSREEMTRLLQTRLIRKFSKCLGIPKVMLSSDGDQLAHLAISQLCLGRGARVSDMTDVVENTPQGITFIRPLRSISSEEIATALRLENVEHYVLIPAVSTPFTSHYVYEARCKGSLQQCTSKFLGKLLDDGFKGTVPNILGAVGKIHIRNGGRLCSLCEYSFCGEGMLCYACSNIAKDLPSSVVNDLPFQIGCPSE